MAFGDLKVQDLIYEDGSNSEITVVLADLVVRDGSGNLVQADNKKFIAGTGNDLQIYHDGSNSIIKNTTGDLIIEDTGGNLIFRPKTGEDAIKAYADGAVELYHDNAKKLETTTSGAKLSSSGDASLWILAGEGGDAYVTLFADEGDNGTDKFRLRATDSAGFLLENSASGSWETSLKANGNAAVELYYDNSKKFETLSDGVKVSGWIYIPDSDASNNMLRLGNGADLKLYHDGSHSRIVDSGTGNLILTSNQVQINNSGNTEVQAKFIENGAVELYYNGVKKVQTNSSGVNIPNNGDYLSIGSSGNENSGRIGYQSNYQLYIHNNRGTATKLLLDNAGKIKSQIWDGSNLTDRFEVNTSGIKVHGPALGNNVGDEVLLANFYNTVSNGSNLEIFTKRHSTATDWTGACTRIQQKIDSTDQAYIQFNNPDYGILLGNNQHGDDKYLQCSPDGPVELFFDGSKKFETNSQGIKVSNSSWATVEIIAAANDATLLLENEAGADHDWTIRNDFSENNDLDIRYNNVRKMNLDSSGNLMITGNFDVSDNDKLLLGNSDDLQIYHNGTNSWIKNTAGYLLLENTSTSQPLYIQSGSRIVMQPSGGGDVLFEANKDGNVELYYDNSKKFETTSSGVNITGTLNVNGSAFSGGMPVHTANGANVANGEAFLLTSTSAIPSSWAWNGSYFTAKHRWIGWGQPRGVSSSFKFMQIFHTPHATSMNIVYWMFRNGSSWSQNNNLNSYLPILVIRIADS